MESFWASSSGVVYGLDHTLTELTLELAIGVEPERLEPASCWAGRANNSRKSAMAHGSSLSEGRVTRST
jgi:hypothetical protein